MGSRSKRRTGMASITENNPQVLRAIQLFQKAAHDGISSGLPFRVSFDELAGNGGRLHDWYPPAVSIKEALAKIGSAP